MVFALTNGGVKCHGEKYLSAQEFTKAAGVTLSGSQEYLMIVPHDDRLSVIEINGRAAQIC